MPPGCPPAPLPPGQCLCAEFHRGSWTRYPLGAWPGPCAPKDLLGSESLSVTGGATARLALSGKQSPHFATGKRSGLSEPRLLGEERPFPPRPGLPTGILLAGRAPAGQPASAPGPSGPSPSGARCLCSASRGLTAALALCLPADVSRCVAERKYTPRNKPGRSCSRCSSPSAATTAPTARCATRGGAAGLSRGRGLPSYLTVVPPEGVAVTNRASPSPAHVLLSRPCRPPSLLGDGPHGFLSAGSRLSLQLRFAVSCGGEHAKVTSGFWGHLVSQWWRLITQCSIWSVSILLLPIL